LSYERQYANFTIVRREFSAGGIVYQKQGVQILWLVRKPAANAGYRGNLGWSFPKGLVDEGEKLDQAAVREVREEGGVEAKIITKLPTLKIFFTGQNGEKVMKFVTYFVMEYTKDLSEGFGWETAETKWATSEEAQNLLVYKNEKELLQKATEVIKSADA